MMNEKASYEELLRQVKELKNKVIEDDLLKQQRELIFANSLDMIGSGDLEGYFKDINPSFERILGYSREEFLANPFIHFVCDEDRAKTKIALMAATKGKQEINIENRYKCKDGSIKWIDWRVSVLIQENQFIAVGRDITEFKRTENQLRHLNQLNEQIIENAQEGIVVYGCDFRYQVWNPFMENLSGKSADEVIGRHPLEVFPFLKDIGIIERVERALQGESMPAIDFPYDLSSSNKSGWTSDICSPLKNADGDIIGALGIVRDITDRKKTEETLTKKEAEYRSLFNKMLDGFAHHKIICDEKGTPVDYRFLHANPSFERLTGLKVDNLIGKTVLEVMPNIEQHWIGTYGQVALTGEPVTFENFSTALDKHFSVTAYSPSKNHFACIFQDITDRKKAALQLKEQKSFIQDAIDTQKDTFFLFDPFEGKAILWNKAFKEISGYSNEEISLLKSPDSYYSKEDLEKASKYVESILSGGAGIVELELICKDGHRVPTEYSVSIVRDAEGNPNSLISIGRDISDRKKAEEEKVILEAQLRQAQKMEAIGTLAGGIAHDFNNLLSAIIGYTEMVQIGLPADSHLVSDLQEVIQAGNRAADLVKQILTFSRQGDQKLKPLKIQLVIKEALKLLRSSIPATIEIKQNIDPACEAILADSTQIHQIIMNLCTNAYHAMSETGGVIDVSLEPVELTSEDLKSKINLQPGSYVKLVVSDTGQGISKDILDKIFEPYFTTKVKDKGTGLGLAMVHGIVISFGGDITVYSEIGQGTSFHIYLPIIKEIKEVIPDEKTAELPTGNERILVVDDDEELARINKRMLESLGYKVTALISSVDSLETFQQKPNDFDLVITDMIMPNMTGAEFSRKILAIQPGMPIILCTGYSELINADKAKHIGIRDYVMKPVMIKDLAKVVRKVLDAS